MITMAKRQTLSVWIALMAILFSALAPSISQAISADRSAGTWSEICSASGIKRVPALDADDATQPAKKWPQHWQQCAYCATHGGTFALLPPAAVTLPVLRGHDSYPSLFYTAAAPLFAWHAAQPRGPPTTS